MKYAILTDAQVATFEARAATRAEAFAVRGTPGRRVRKPPPTTYSPGARGWSVPWAVYRDPRVTAAEGGRNCIAVEDTYFDDMPAAMASRFTATVDDLHEILSLDIADIPAQAAQPTGGGGR